VPMRHDMPVRLFVAYHETHRSLIAAIWLCIDWRFWCMWNDLIINHRF
jgi:hypothetical protein